MATGNRKDPLTVFSFRLSIKDISGVTLAQPATAFFKSVSGLKADMEVQEVREGGENYKMLKLPGMIKWPNLVFKRGFTGDLTFYGQFAMSVFLEPTKRLSGVIEHLGPGGVVKARWKFASGFVCKWDGGELDASKNELAIETFEIAHEGLFAG